MRDKFGGDCAAGAWSVVNHEWLAESFRHPLAHQSCGDVGRLPRGGIQRRCAPAAPDSPAPTRFLREPETRQLLLQAAEIYVEEASWGSPAKALYANSRSLRRDYDAGPTQRNFLVLPAV